MSFRTSGWQSYWKGIVYRPAQDKLQKLKALRGQLQMKEKLIREVRLCHCGMVSACVKRLQESFTLNRARTFKLPNALIQYVQSLIHFIVSYRQWRREGDDVPHG